MCRKIEDKKPCSRCGEVEAKSSSLCPKCRRKDYHKSFASPYKDVSIHPQTLQANRYGSKIKKAS